MRSTPPRFGVWAWAPGIARASRSSRESAARATRRAIRASSEGPGYECAILAERSGVDGADFHLAAVDHVEHPERDGRQLGAAAIAREHRVHPRAQRRSARVDELPDATGGHAPRGRGGRVQARRAATLGVEARPP